MTGVIIATSLIHDGPAPHFVSVQLFDAMTSDPTKVVVPVAALPESSMKDELLCVSTV